MEYIQLNRETDYEWCQMVLNLQDVKILYNACVDILNRNPEMIGYQRVAQKLKMVIESNDNS